MRPLEFSVSDATIWSVTLIINYNPSSIIYDVYSTGITYDDHQLTIITCLSYRLQDSFDQCCSDIPCLVD